jgi:threonine dehydrogenase-like Zn-dependent dehydrogenase
VVVCSTIACGHCSYCRVGYFAQCDNANPNGKLAGTAFFGGPESTGPFDGLQAGRARIPYANTTLVRLPHEVSDEQALPISDIFPTGWFGAKLAEVSEGDTVAVFGCGPVGQFAIISAFLQGASRVLAVDAIPDRLEAARSHTAEVIDFEAEDPVETIRRLTGGIGVDKAIDAVGVDATSPEGGPAASSDHDEQSARELAAVASETNPQGETFVPGDAPSQALRWAVDALAKAGTLAIIGVYSPELQSFPIGQAFNKNLTLRMGNCNHVPELVELVRTGAVDPSTALTNIEGVTDAISAYRAFDERQPGWLKVELEPTA